MLFDLKSGKRRRVVQVVFGFLAFIFFISFVGFGIGSDVSRRHLRRDRPRRRRLRASRPQSAYEQQIDEAEKKLDEDPKDEQALTDLARYRFLSGQENSTSTRRPGSPTLTEEARSEWNEALDAWESLLKTGPAEGRRAGRRPDDLRLRAAAPAVRGAGPGRRARPRRRGPHAAADRRGRTRGRPATSSSPQFLYFDGHVEAGDEAAAEAVSRAEPNQRERLSQDLEKLAAAGQEVREAAGRRRRERRARSPQLQNPFGGLGSGPAGHPAGVSLAPSLSAARARRPSLTFAAPGPLAQLVEQETLNLKVTGSIPVRPIVGTQPPGSKRTSSSRPLPPEMLRVSTGPTPSA